MTSFGFVTTVLGVAVLLLAEWRQWSGVKAVAKPVASTGFVAVALQAGALDSSYGQLLVAGLVASWVGDVMLLSSRRRWFLIGLVAFAVAHVGYAGAFAVRGLNAAWTIFAAAGLAVVAVIVHRWLRPHLPDSMVRPVQSYIVIISAMLACACGAFADGASSRLLIGAAAFYASDLAVARERFVAQGFVNRLWGLPLYYAAQLLLASTGSAA